MHLASCRAESGRCGPILRVCGCRHFSAVSARVKHRAGSWKGCPAAGRQHREVMQIFTAWNWTQVCTAQPLALTHGVNFLAFISVSWRLKGIKALYSQTKVMKLSIDTKWCKTRQRYINLHNSFFCALQNRLNLSLVCHWVSVRFQMAPRFWCSPSAQS